MKDWVRPELPTATLRSSQARLAAVDNSAPLATRQESTYKSVKVVQTSGATSFTEIGVLDNLARNRDVGFPRVHGASF